MERSGPRPDEEGFGESDLGHAQSSNPPDDDDMIYADLFLGLDDDEEDED
jgi:hypothetical protein